MRILAITFALMTPSLGFAMGCSGGHQSTVAELPCADGYAWSTDAGQCVLSPTA